MVSKSTKSHESFKEYQNRLPLEHQSFPLVTSFQDHDIQLLNAVLDVESIPKQLIVFSNLTTQSWALSSFYIRLPHLYCKDGSEKICTRHDPFQYKDKEDSQDQSQDDLRVTSLFSLKPVQQSMMPSLNKILTAPFHADLNPHSQNKVTLNSKGSTDHSMETFKLINENLKLRMFRIPLPPSVEDLKLWSWEIQYKQSISNRSMENSSPQEKSSWEANQIQMALQSEDGNPLMADVPLVSSFDFPVRMESIHLKNANHHDVLVCERLPSSAQTSSDQPLPEFNWHCQQP